MRRVALLASLVAATATSACGGGNDTAPGDEERKSAAGVSTRTLEESCRDRVIGIVAVGHASYGKTSGFLVLCDDGRVDAVGRDGGNGGDQERLDAVTVEDGLAEHCDSKPQSVTSLGHGSYGRTSGFLLHCANGRVVPIGR